MIKVYRTSKSDFACLFLSSWVVIVVSMSVFKTVRAEDETEYAMRCETLNTHGVPKSLARPKSIAISGGFVYSILNGRASPSPSCSFQKPRLNDGHLYAMRAVSRLLLNFQYKFCEEIA